MSPYIGLGGLGLGEEILPGLTFISYIGTKQTLNQLLLNRLRGVWLQEKAVALEGAWQGGRLVHPLGENFPAPEGQLKTPPRSYRQRCTVRKQPVGYDPQRC